MGAPTLSGARGRCPMATEQETQARLEALEPRVRHLAWRWSRDAPNAREDLEQVARLAIWKELLREPDAPVQHLLAEAKDAISDERKRGSSVDGRLNPTTRRKRRYLAESMDAPGPRDLPPISETLASGPLHAHNLWESPVEAEALGHLLYEALLPVLTETQNALLALILAGYQCKEAGRLLGMTKQQAWVVRQSIQRTAVEVLGVQYPGMGAWEERRRSAALAAWDRRRPPVPPDVKRLILELFDVLLE